MTGESPMLLSEAAQKAVDIASQRLRESVQEMALKLARSEGRNLATIGDVQQILEILWPAPLGGPVCCRSQRI